ncbi:MAG: helix-turn-helix domain-containing protein [Betaproteobacteria bacterium]
MPRATADKHRPEPAEAPEADPDTREKLKRHARRLFGDRGIDNVSMRDIVLAAGQRNVGAIGYYFGSKDALVREILVEGGALVDRLRNTMLDELEARRGDALTVRDLMWVIVRSTTEAQDEQGEHTCVRVFATVHRHNHALFVEVLGHGLDLGLRRCIAHLRRLLPAHSHAVLNERIRLMLLLMGAALSLREAALEQADAKGPPGAMRLDDLIDACEGLVGQPASAAGSSRQTARASQKG